ncbi:MAG: hypothetical protein M1812_006542 [Candelaria pacifica]|nr:MAG: hypothetical protein M1812_006542 [Candelaria pacifica]
MPSAPDQRLSNPSSRPGAKKPPASPNSVLLAAESQWIFTEEELARTPSALDGMSLEQERENRGKGVNFITQVGIQLKLPQLTLATASIFLQRFFMRHTMVDKPDRPALHYYTVAATATFLATKVEENCRKMREIIVACCRVAQKNPNLVVDEQTREYWKWRDAILHNEDVLLEAICFDLSLQPPYKLLFEYLVYLGEANNKKLRNAAWAFINDSNLTMLCLLFNSRTIAAAALYCAAKHCDTAFVDEFGKPWWDIFGVKLKDIRKACNYMASVYEQSPLRKSENVYNRTPEDGDPLFAKTRARGSPTPARPRTPHLDGVNDKSQGGSAMSRTGSDQGSNKRPRADTIKEEKINGDTNKNGEDTTFKHESLPNGIINHKTEAAEKRDHKRLKTEDADIKPTKTEKPTLEKPTPEKPTPEKPTPEKPMPEKPQQPNKPTTDDKPSIEGTLNNAPEPPQSNLTEDKEEELSEEGEVEA